MRDAIKFPPRKAYLISLKHLLLKTKERGPEKPAVNVMRSEKQRMVSPSSSHHPNIKNLLSFLRFSGIVPEVGVKKIRAPSSLVKKMFKKLSDEEKRTIVDFKPQQWYPCFEDYAADCRKLLKLYKKEDEFRARTCPICPHLGKKIQRMNEGKGFKAFARNKKFKDHWEHKHNKPVLCDICHLEFDSRKGLKGHLESMQVPKYANAAHAAQAAKQ